MKRIIAAVLAYVLLLCFTGCTGNEPPESAPGDGPLTAEGLLGTYDISYQRGTEVIRRTVDLRLLNDRLTFAIYPDTELCSDHSFDSYDPKTGKAQLQKAQQDERGELTVSCIVTFAEAGGTISVSGYYKLMRGEEEEDSCTFSSKQSEKL